MIRIFRRRHEAPVAFLNGIDTLHGLLANDPEIAHFGKEV